MAGYRSIVLLELAISSEQHQISTRTLHTFFDGTVGCFAELIGIHCIELMVKNGTK
jgi:hypothetical protein